MIVTFRGRVLPDENSVRLSSAYTTPLEDLPYQSFSSSRYLIYVYGSFALSNPSPFSGPPFSLPLVGALLSWYPHKPVEAKCREDIKYHKDGEVAYIVPRTAHRGLQYLVQERVGVCNRAILAVAACNRVQHGSTSCLKILRKVIPAISSVWWTDDEKVHWRTADIGIL